MTRWLMLLALVIGCGRIDFTAEPSDEAVDALMVECIGDLAATGDQACYVDDAGRAWCWGSNGYGSLAQGDTAPRAAPTQVMGLPPVTQIHSGEYSVCAVTAIGEAYCWGNNTNYQLGDGSMTDRAFPVRLTLPPVKRIGVAEYHGCALTTGDDLWCWGINGSGETGVGNVIAQTVPAVSVLTGVLDFALSDSTTCVIRADRTAQCVGRGATGELGHGMFASSQTPVTVVGLSDVRQVVGGVHHSFCARTGDESTWCWGTNELGQLGNGSTANSAVPLRVPIPGAVAIGLGPFHGCAVTTSGEVWCWGDNQKGQHGVVDGGPSTPRAVPGFGSGASGATEVDGGSGFSCARRVDGQIWCWGANNIGQLGRGTTSPSEPPGPVALSCM